MQNNEIVAYDGDLMKRFNVTQLREIRELFHDVMIMQILLMIKMKN